MSEGIRALPGTGGTTTGRSQPLRVASLFTGIGGIELGLHRAGHRTRLMCEFDGTARAVLARQFPSVTLRHDVRRLRRLPTVELVAAGFPCQDLSQAGRKSGIDGAESSLVQHLFRLVDAAKSKPEWLLIENVSYMLRLDRGRGMAFLVDQIERLGYRWAYRVVDARSFGVPQRRKRVIMLAARSEDPRRVLFADEAGIDPLLDQIGPVDPSVGYGFYWTEGLRGLGWAKDAVPTIKGGSRLGIPSPPAIWNPSTGMIGTPTLADVERLQGFEPGWTASADEAKTPRKGARWHLMGNAVCVHVAAWVGQRLVAPGEPVVAGKEYRRNRWPIAAWGERGRVFEVSLSDHPVAAPKRHLLPFLSEPLVPLSARATAGFHRRANTGSLRFSDGFIDAVRDHLHVMEAKAA